jgi:hypothetical protein
MSQAWDAPTHKASLLPGEGVDPERIAFLEEGDASLRSWWHRCAMLRHLHGSGGASIPGYCL